MMESAFRKILPIGIESFEKMITGNYYYVDKTLFIKELLDNLSEVSLFLRPRRFGKSLMLDTVQCFFEDTGDGARNAQRRSLFDGLAIMGVGERYRKQMTGYPVICISLKDAKQATFEKSLGYIKKEITREFRRLGAIRGCLDAERLSDYRTISEGRGDEIAYGDALRLLSECLSIAFGGKKVVILIDEYDVPLESAHFGGYFDDMATFIRSLFSSALKSNEFLAFAVVTGCLRVSQESIFTGMNNLSVHTILGNKFCSAFGFTQAQAQQIMFDYDLMQRMDDVKAWYDGYRIGNEHLYNPWSLLTCISEMTANPDAPCEAFWANTSSNSIVKQLVESAGAIEREQLETLMGGGTVYKRLLKNVTYRQLSQGGGYLWEFMLYTGYLTLDGSQVPAGDQDDAETGLIIPNIEILNLYRDIVTQWFSDAVKRNDQSPLYRALFAGDAGSLSTRVTEILYKSISYFDYAEKFYHALLLGLLHGIEGYDVRSNRESGTGRPDIMLVPADKAKPCVIIECKPSRTEEGLSAACDQALQQIDVQGYARGARTMGFGNIICYGAAFWKKRAEFKSFLPQ
jgi:hypothetical protein